MTARNSKDQVVYGEAHPIDLETKLNMICIESKKINAPRFNLDSGKDAIVSEDGRKWIYLNKALYDKDLKSR